MSATEIRKVTAEDVQLVLNLIERCLMLYMSKQEVINTLLRNAKVEACITETVWNRIEDQNQEFFKAYNARLTLKDQIIRFNKLLEIQAELTPKISSSGATVLPMSIGSDIPPLPQNFGSRTKDVTGDHQFVFTAGAPSLQPLMQTDISMSSHKRMSNILSNQNLGQNEIMHGMMNSEAGHGTQPSALYASEFIQNPMNETTLDADIGSFGFPNHFPNDFNISNLLGDFASGSANLHEPGAGIFSNALANDGLSFDPNINMLPPTDISGQFTSNHILPNLSWPESTQIMQEINNASPSFQFPPSATDISGQFTTNNILPNLSWPENNLMQEINNVSPNFQFPPSTNFGTMQEINQGNNTSGDGLEGLPPMGPAPVSSFAERAPCETLEVLDAQLPDILGQIPTNFNLSEFNPFE